MAHGTSQPRPPSDQLPVSVCCDASLSRCQRHVPLPRPPAPAATAATTTPPPFAELSPYPRPANHNIPKHLPDWLVQWIEGPDPEPAFFARPGPHAHTPNTWLPRTRSARTATTANAASRALLTHARWGARCPRGKRVITLLHRPRLFRTGGGWTPASSRKHACYGSRTAQA